MTDELRSSPPAILSPNLLRRTWQMIFFSNLVVFSREREVLLPLAMMLVLFFFLFTPEPPPCCWEALPLAAPPHAPPPTQDRDVGVTPCIMYYYKGIEGGKTEIRRSIQRYKVQRTPKPLPTYLSCS